MLALANHLASRAARLLSATHEPALWSISTRHRVVGSLVCEAGHWRLAWFAGADPRLANYARSTATSRRWRRRSAPGSAAPWSFTRSRSRLTP
jgi:hypothetical protein